MTLMPFFLETETRMWSRRGILAKYTPAERQIILACARPSHRSNGTRSLCKDEILMNVAAAASKIRLRRARIPAVLDATYEVSHMRDWEERRIQGAIRRGILTASHDGCAIDDRLRPLVEPCEDLRWSRKPLGHHAALAFSGIAPSLRDRADDPRRLRAEAAVQRGIVPTDSIKVKFGSSGFYDLRENQAVEDPVGFRKIHRRFKLDRRRWDEVVSFGLDACKNGLVLAVHHAVVEEPCGRIFEVEAAQRGHRLTSVKVKVIYAVAAYDGQVWLYADRGVAQAKLDIIAAHYWKAQSPTDVEEAVSAEDAAAFAGLVPGAE
jgi:hypothetical protein